jgi:hypothetical protein
MSALDSYLSRSSYIRSREQVKVWPGLETADAGGTGPRIIMAEASVDRFFMLIPQPFRQNQELRRAFGWKVPCWGLTAGLIMKYPKAVVYADI